MSRSLQSPSRTVSQPIQWTDIAPPFWMVREGSRLYAVFEDQDMLFLFDTLYPHVFNADGEIIDYAGEHMNAIDLGIIQ